MILFCNDGFGRPFQAWGVAEARRGKHLRIVFSGRQRAARNPIRNVARRLRRRARILRWQARFRLAGVAFEIVDDVNDESFAGTIKPDEIGLVTGFNQIFTEPLIDRFGTLLNVHPSVLPCYPGASPSSECLRRGESRTGFTIHRLTPEVDAGPILAQGVVDIEGTPTAVQLDRIIASKAVPVAAELLAALSTSERFPARLVNPRAVYRHCDWLAGSQVGSSPSRRSVSGGTATRAGARTHGCTDGPAAIRLARTAGKDRGPMAVNPAAARHASPDSRVPAG